jgi:fatty acid desaturase
VNHADGGLVTELLCPVGLRFHSLHHMLPSLPYHSLPEAHRILMRELPPDSTYRQTNSPSICATVAQLLHDAHCAGALKPRRS